MNGIVEAKVESFLINWLKYSVYDCGTIIDRMKAQALAAGYDQLDERFADAGLGAGPEARVASRVVSRALLGGGDETPDDAFRKEIDTWLRTSPRKGKR